MAALKCLIVDWGGVLTTPIGASWRAWAAEAGIDIDAFDTVMAQMLHADPAHPQAAEISQAYERGELSDQEFEAYLMRRLDLDRPGILLGLWQGLAGAPDMVEVVRRAKWHGLTTGLLSNSWGVSAYDRTGWDELFDGVVLSGEVGMRKPDREIYQYTAERLAVSPSECVFVDDLVINVRGAAAAGMVGVHHQEVHSTVIELEALFDLEFSI